MSLFPNHYRLKPHHVIRDGDMELVQEVELQVIDRTPEGIAEVKQLGHRILREGKGWQLKPIPRGYHGQKVEDTSNGVTMHMDVWRPRKVKI